MLRTRNVAVILWKFFQIPADFVGLLDVLRGILAIQQKILQLNSLNIFGLARSCCFHSKRAIFVFSIKEWSSLEVEKRDSRVVEGEEITENGSLITTNE